MNSLNNQFGFLLLVMISVFIYGLFAQSVVEISQGLVQGTILETRNGRNISAFIGIPYAQPPIGKLRWNFNIFFLQYLWSWLVME